MNIPVWYCLIWSRLNIFNCWNKGEVWAINELLVILVYLVFRSMVGLLSKFFACKALEINEHLFLCLLWPSGNWTWTYPGLFSGQSLWFVTVLMNKLVLCAWLSNGALEVWRLWLQDVGMQKQIRLDKYVGFEWYRLFYKTSFWNWYLSLYLQSWNLWRQNEAW